MFCAGPVRTRQRWLRLRCGVQTGQLAHWQARTDDGLRVTLADKRIIHFRPSGNAPEMRCYVEAETEQAASQLLDAGLNRITHWAGQN
ncbi:hypothetical protein [Rhizobium sullae]|uniref:hypothetical protein n=1 Tax=Rhizobium sullae TaxID=50338 RepID=UPI003CC812E0